MQVTSSCCTRCVSIIPLIYSGDKNELFFRNGQSEYMLYLSIFLLWTFLCDVVGSDEGPNVIGGDISWCAAES